MQNCDVDGVVRGAGLTTAAASSFFALSPSPPSLLSAPFLRLAAMVGRKPQLARVSSLAVARGLIGGGLGFGAGPDVEDGIDGRTLVPGRMAASRLLLPAFGVTSRVGVADKEAGAGVNASGVAGGGCGAGVRVVGRSRAERAVSSWKGKRHGARN